MGGAFLARADDATAASWNPAGLSYLKRPEVSVVGVRNTFQNTVANAAGTFIERDRLTGDSPDFLAVTYPIDVASRSGAAQVSFQRVLSYDAARTIRREDRTFEISASGGFDVLAAGTGIQLSRSLRVGATLNRWFNGYEQTTDRLGLARGQVRLLHDFEISGWNVNGGFIYAPFESLNFGGVVKTGFTGKVTLTRERFDTSAEGVSTTNYSRSRSVRLDFPGAVGFGVSWRPTTPLTLSVDYTRTGWSEGRIRNYFTLPIQGQPEPESEDFFQSLPFPLLFAPLGPAEQRDTEQARFGIEYVVIRSRLKVPFRAGYFRDYLHFPDLEGRRPVFKGFTAGVGLVVGPILLDTAFVFERGKYRDVAGDRVDATIRRLYVSIIYRHGG